MQVKVFSSKSFSSPENKINKWLSENSDIEVVYVSQSQCGAICDAPDSYVDYKLTNLTVIVWYKEKALADDEHKES